MSQSTLPKITVVQLDVPRTGKRTLARGTSFSLTPAEAGRFRSKRPLFRPSRRLPELGTSRKDGKQD
jgi:hypothetical protein